MEHLEFTKVEISDLEKLQQISIKTFSDTFRSSNSEENLAGYINENMSLQNLEIELKTQNSDFYFANLNSETIGYLKLNFGRAQTEKFDKNATEIHRIYVLKEFQGKKVGAFFLKKTLEIAKEKNSNFIWLGVWEKNYKAIGFYEKQGFITFDKHDFMLGNDSQTDLIMKLVLNQTF
ncbi:MAG: GNAT family N-acetyltransferase [Chryseobacterium sp.]|nr:GNAT family N-acetyltransferase [Chryseobacterium sp.]